MKSLTEIVIAICIIWAIALAVPLIGAALAVLEAAVCQESNDNAE